MGVIIKKQCKPRTDERRCTQCTLRSVFSGHVNRSDEPMEEGYARALLPALQKAMYSTSFGRRTAH